MAGDKNILNGALLEAVEKKDLSKVIDLLAKGADPNAKRKKKSALDLASPLAHEIRCELIEAGARQTSLKKSLVWAVSRGRPATVKALIEYGADINLLSNVGTPIMEAISKGCEECFELLMAADCDLGLVSTFSTVLSRAVEHQRWEFLERLLEAGCEPDLKPLGGHSALVVAIDEGREKALLPLLKAGADSNQLVETFVTGGALFKATVKHHEVRPLHIAVLKKNLQAAELLLENGAKACQRDGQGKLPLDIAEEMKQKKLTSLLRKLTKSQVATKPSGQAWLEACESGQLALVEEMLLKGTELELRDERTKTKGYTGLLLAAKGDHESVVELLLARGADPNARAETEDIPSYLLSNIDDPNQLQEMGYSLGRTSLLYALHNKNAALGKTLLKHGADPLQESALKETPLLLAAALDDVEILTTLKESGVKLDKAARGRWTALMKACEAGAVRSAEYLLKNKCKADRKNGEGDTPLMLACSGGYGEIVSLLLAAGAKATSDKGKRGPLESAIEASKLVPYKSGMKSFIATHYGPDGATTYAPLEEKFVLPIVEALIEAGANPKSSSGSTTCIGSAAQFGHLNVVKLLIEKGANPRQQDDFGSTALDYAKMFERPEIAEFLRSLPKTKKVEKPAKTKPVAAERPKARYAKVPNLSRKTKSKKFAKALRELGELCGSEAILLDNYAEVQVNSAIQESQTVEALQEKFSKSGYFLVDCTGSSEKPIRLALFPTPEWKEALAVMETNGINYDVASLDIIEWLEETEKENPFKVLGLKHDIVSGRFLSKVKQPKMLAKRMYDLCPDCIDQGLGSMEELIKHLKKEANFFLWWD